MLCVRLDPDQTKFPATVHGSVFDFCTAIVDATADVVCAFKPQIAYFSAIGAERDLERLCEYIRERYPDILLVLDAKRGDMGSTAEQYAREAFDRYRAHVVTVNPYLGTDSVEPFLCHPDGGIFVLCRTSNTGGDETVTAPSLGVLLEYQWLMGASKNFALTLGLGAKALSIKDNFSSSDFVARYPTARVSVGYSF